jgi:hypothetical protein
MLYGLGPSATQKRCKIIRCVYEILITHAAPLCIVLIP